MLLRSKKVKENVMLRTHAHKHSDFVFLCGHVKPKDS